MEKAPDAFRTISEAAAELNVPQHVLRFWETRFSQIRPMKRAGGRRYYRPQDIDLLKGIRRLLHEEGYTIKGVQRILREHGVAHVIAIGRGQVELAAPAVMATALAREGGQASAVEEAVVDAERSGAAGTGGMVGDKLRAELEQALRELATARNLLKRMLASSGSAGGGKRGEK